MAVVKKKGAAKKQTKLKAVENTQIEKYELMVIIKSLITEDARAKVQNQLVKTIQKLGGEITSTDVWGKKHLAYEIDGNGEGYYIVYKVDLPVASAGKFDDAMKLNSDIIRYLLLKEDSL